MKAFTRGEHWTIVEIDGLGDIIAYSVKTYFEQPSVQLIQELQDRWSEYELSWKDKRTVKLQDIFYGRLSF